MKSKKSFFQDSRAISLSDSCNDPFILFVFWPFVKTIQLSFARTTPLGQVAQYVGLDNYTNIFTDGTFLNSLVTTLKFSVMRVILSIVLGFILAIISTEKIRAKGFFRTVYALPMAISAAAASVVFMFIFHSSLGILNKALGTHIGWLTDKKYALIAVTIVSVWMAIGMNFIYLTAAIQSVPAELYESVALDGQFLPETPPCNNPVNLSDTVLPSYYQRYQLRTGVRRVQDDDPGGRQRVPTLSCMRFTRRHLSTAVSV